MNLSTSYEGFITIQFLEMRKLKQRKGKWHKIIKQVISKIRDRDLSLNRLAPQTAFFTMFEPAFELQIGSPNFQLPLLETQ